MPDTRITIPQEPTRVPPNIGGNAVPADAQPTDTPDVVGNDVPEDTGGIPENAQPTEVLVYDADHPDIISGRRLCARGQLIMGNGGRAVIFPAVSFGSKGKPYRVAFASMVAALAKLGDVGDAKNLVTSFSCVEGVVEAFAEFAREGLLVNYAEETVEEILNDAVLDMSHQNTLMAAYQGGDAQPGRVFTELGGDSTVPI